MSGCGITVSSYNIIWQCMVGGRHSNIRKSICGIILSGYDRLTSRYDNNIAGDCTI